MPEYFSGQQLRTARKNAALLILTLLVLAVVRPSPVAAQAALPDAALLLKGVGTLPAPPGACASYALQPTASVLAAGPLEGSSDITAGIILTGKYGSGRLVMLGAEKYLDTPFLRHPAVARLLRNVLGTQRTGGIGLYGKMPALQRFLQAAGRTGIYEMNGSILPGTRLVFIGQDIKEKRPLQVIDSFLRKGGTVVFASPLAKMYAASGGQEWQPAFNQILIQGGMYHVYNPVLTGLDTLTSTIPAYLDLNRILQSIEQGTYPEVFKTDREKYVTHLELTLLNGLGTDSSAGLQRLRKALGLNGKTPPALATTANPVYKGDWKNYMAHLYDGMQMDKVLHEHGDTVDPTFRYFPGAVSEPAPRVDTTVFVKVRTGSDGLAEPDPVYCRLHGTGLYVPAGEKVTVRFPAADTALHLKLQVGIHDDDFYNSDKLVRQIYGLTRSFDVTDTLVTVSSPWGGLLYLAIPDTVQARSLALRVKGAVRAPRYVAGETSMVDWKCSRQDAAPWAELETGKLILTVPSARIRQLENPDTLMAFWDEVMDADADLAHIPRQRKHPERILIDVESPYGYMCTTVQKIYAPDDESCALMLNQAALRAKGSWGHFHELGHRHQFWPLDFDGLGEVTVNLYTMYVYDKVLHKGLYNHEEIDSPAAVRKKIAAYFLAGPTPEKFGQDPFAALCMYIQLIENFGWDPIMTVFKNYREMPADQYPKTQEEKRDLWFTQISRATQHNLAGFFNAWKVPVSAAAVKTVAQYPAWLPEELSVYVHKSVE